MRDDAGDGGDPPDEADDGGTGAPICGCGVTAIPAETTSFDHPRFVCENPDCEAFGTELT